MSSVLAKERKDDRVTDSFPGRDLELMLPTKLVWIGRGPD